MSNSKRSSIRQNVLYDGNTIEYVVKAKGGEDLLVTLAYTDPAYQNVTVADEDGSIPALSLDPTTSMLINDIDVEIVTPSSTVIGPWLLDPSNPSSNATAPGVGNDDDRNNVKQVRIAAASVVADGMYIVRVKCDAATALKVAKKQTSSSNYELVTTQTGQPAFQRFSLVVLGNHERKEDKFETTDIDRAGDQQTAYALNYQRAGSAVATEIDHAIRAAVRRRVLLNEDGELRVNRASISEMEEADRDFMKEQFLAAISQGGRTWTEREDAARLYAQWFGFRRTGSQIQDRVKSLINGLLRNQRLDEVR